MQGRCPQRSMLTCRMLARAMLTRAMLSYAALLACAVSRNGERIMVPQSLPAPRKRGRGTALRSSVVEGASEWTIVLSRKQSADARAPSTTLRSLCELRAVPLPRCAGAGGEIEIRSRGATKRPSYAKPISEVVTTGLDPVVHTGVRRANAGGSTTQASLRHGLPDQVRQ